MKNSTVETLIGAAVIAIAAVFFLFARNVGGQRRDPGAQKVARQPFRR